MHPLSTTTLTWIDEVHRLAGKRMWKRATSLERITTRLAEIGSSGQMSAICRIVSLTLDGRREIAESAARAVARLLRDVRVEHVSKLDREFREFCYGAAWHRMEPGDVTLLSALPDGDWALVCAMSHRNGYVREQATQELVSRGDGSVLPFLLLRTNDWVPAVRSAARAAVTSRLRPECLHDLVAMLPMLERMTNWGRRGQDGVVAKVDALFLTEEAAGPLQGALASPDRFVRTLRQ